MPRRDEYTPIAESVPFDNDTNGFISDNVQDAIEELQNNASISASPGYGFGRSGNVSNNTWLLRVGSVPSNKTGVNVGLYNAELMQVSTGSEELDTYDLEIWQHDGNFTNPILITTVSVTASRKEVFNITGASLTINKHIAIKLVNGSAKNIGVDLQITGTNMP